MANDDRDLTFLAEVLPWLDDYDASHVDETIEVSQDDADSLLAIPDGLSDVHASMLLVNPTSAWLMVVKAVWMADNKKGNALEASMSKVKAGDLMGFVAGQLGGKGGGRPDMAQGGGTNVTGLEAALASVVPWVKTQLGQ